jgi:signal transduction histidine kinase
MLTFSKCLFPNLDGKRILVQKTFLFLFFLVAVLSCARRKEIAKPTTVNTYYDKAFEFRENDQPDSAFFYFNIAKDVFFLKHDSLGTAKCLVNMANISTDKGDYFGGQELSLEAIAYLNLRNKDEYPYIVSNLNNLGISYYNLKNYHRAIEFYERALNYTADSITSLGIKNNMANAYRQMRQYSKALTLYKSILNQPLETKEHARLLSNYNYTLWLQNPKSNVAPGLLKALRLRHEADDTWGLNSSYAQLADFYELSKPDSALHFALNMYSTARILQNPDDRIEALQRMIRLSAPEAAKQYFRIYRQLSDSIQSKRAEARNQFAGIRYESAFNKAENLKLQQENTKKEYQLIIRDLLIWMVVIVFCALSFTAFFWSRKRRQKIESDARKAIAESRLKTSKQVHDVVANGIYRVMAEIENQDNIEKEDILDRLDNMYQQSRDISYQVEESIVAQIPLEDRINQLVASFRTNNTTIALKGALNKIGEKVSPAIQDELETIVQELLVNMKKHSFATAVIIHFYQQDNLVTLEYKDDGIGMQEAVQFNNGLRNTGNRIDVINGEITFKKNLEKGLHILVTFPVS